MESRKTTWLVLVAIALLVGIIVGAVVGASLNAQDAEEILATEEETARLQAAVDNAEERIWKLYRERNMLQEQLDARETSDPPSPTLEDVLGDGVYLVDEDIAPGEYTGVLVAETGYWARLKNTDGTVNSVIESRLVTGPFVVTIIESDRALELRGVHLNVD